MDFNSVFQQFRETGCFSLHAVSINLNQLKIIKRYLERPIFRLYHWENSHCQLHLSDIKLTAYYENSAHLILTGAITAEEYRAATHDKQTDFRLWQMSTGHRNNVAPQYTEEKISVEKKIQTCLEDALLSLFDLPFSWDSIKLENIVISQREHPSKLSPYFLLNLFLKLEENFPLIKELSLKQVIFQGKALYQFLKKARVLETLRLESLSLSQDILKPLSAVLLAHPALTLLDLGKSKLDEEGYKALLVLLDINYRLEQIDIEKPAQASESLKELHSQLSERMQLSGVKRFEQEQLSQPKLLNLAEAALESTAFARLLPVILSQAPESVMLPYVQRQALFQEACCVWPEVYRQHPEHLQQCWPSIRLDISQDLKDGKSIGYYLLEKAFYLNNTPAIKLLLQAGANLLEKSQSDKDSLLDQLFVDKNMPAWKQVFIDHLQENISTLAPMAFRLTHFDKVDAGIREIKEHLDRYLTILVERTSVSFLLQLFSGTFLRLDERKQEWKQALRLLVTAVEKGTRKKTMDYRAMNELHQFVKILIGESHAANRGWLGKSQLNDKLESIGNRLDEAIEKCKWDLFCQTFNKKIYVLASKEPSHEEKRKQVEAQQEEQKQPFKTERTEMEIADMVRDKNENQIYTTKWALNSPISLRTKSCQK